jgi:hypothetical protein
VTCNSNPAYYDTSWDTLEQSQQPYAAVCKNMSCHSKVTGVQIGPQCYAHIDISQHAAALLQSGTCGIQYLYIHYVRLG